MTIRKQVTLKQLNKIFEKLPGHMNLSMFDALDYYMQKIMVRHFQFGNEAAYGFKKLNPVYAERKRKKFGNKPMLVASGTLKDNVLSRYKIYKIAEKFRIVLNMPTYGRYVQEIRDFTIVNQRDRKDMMHFWKKSLVERRKRFVSSLGR